MLHNISACDECESYKFVLNLNAENCYSTGIRTITLLLLFTGNNFPG